MSGLTGIWLQEMGTIAYCGITDSITPCSSSLTPYIILSKHVNSDRKADVNRQHRWPKKSHEISKVREISPRNPFVGLKTTLAMVSNTTSSLTCLIWSSPEQYESKLLADMLRLSSYLRSGLSRSRTSKLRRRCCRVRL